MTTDTLKAYFKFPFDDPDWKQKFLIGSLITFISVVFIFPFIFVYGYCAQAVRPMLKEGGEPYLPAWDDWGKLFSDGLKVWGAMFVYMLPIFVFLCGGLSAMFGSIYLTENAVEPDPTLPFAGMAVFLTGMCCMMVWSIGVGVVMPAAVSHVIYTGEFSAAFRFGEWWSIFRKNLGGFIVVFLVSMGISFGLQIIFQVMYYTVILCVVIPFLMPLTSFYISLVLYAHAYRDAIHGPPSPSLAE